MFFPVVIVIVLLVAVVLVVVAHGRSQTELFEYPWEEKMETEFLHQIGRPIDVIHRQYYIKNTKNLSMLDAMRFIRNDLKDYGRQVDRGKKILEKSSIVIAGLLQNEASSIQSLRAQCENMTTGCKDYRIIIVENNSEDNTREYLLDWAREDPRVIILCQDPFMTNSDECDLQYMFSMYESNQLAHSPLPRRIERMAFLRNVYLTHIKYYYKDFDFLCVMDMDLQGELFMDGYYQSLSLLQDDKIRADGIAGNGMILRGDQDYYYYDSFAYVEEGEPIIWETTTDKSNHDQYVHMYITNRYSSQMHPDRVRSAFGGIALYRMSSVLKNRYDFSTEYYSCEHAYFHDQIKVWVNPRFIFLIERNR